jgi:hypothetical protein
MIKITRVTGGSRGEDAQAVLAEIQAMGRKAIAFQLDTGDVSPSATGWGAATIVT